MGQSEQGHRPATNLLKRRSDAKVPRMKKADIRLFFERPSAADQTTQTELAFTNNFTLLVAIVLSAQATDKGVNWYESRPLAMASLVSSVLGLNK